MSWLHKHGIYKWIEEAKMSVQNVISPVMQRFAAKSANSSREGNKALFLVWKKEAISSVKIMTLISVEGCERGLLIARDKECCVCS